MPTLTVTNKQADELTRLTYEEAAALLRQAADSLQEAAESARQLTGPAAEDLGLHVEQARDALDLVATVGLPS